MRKFLGTPKKVGPLCETRVLRVKTYLLKPFLLVYIMRLKTIWTIWKKQRSNGSVALKNEKSVME